MEIKEADREYMRFKMAQARDAYEEAKGLFADGADVGYVINSLFYAFYYPVLALLHSRQIQSAMQSVSIALFEKEFVETGVFEKRVFNSLQRAFNLKPKCSSEGLAASTRAEVEELLAEAREFLEAVALNTGIS